MTTCLPNSKNASYMLLNLVGEVGEIAGKVSKVIRKGEAHFTGYGNIGFNKTEPEIEEGIKKEVGDVLWQLSGLCSVMGWSLEDWQEWFKGHEKDTVYDKPLAIIHFTNFRY